MANSEEATDRRRFTQQELADFDGQDGRPAYVAYEGKVFDVTESKLWRKGKHVRVHFAGVDLTREMAAAPHEADVMDRMPQVGVIAEEAGEAGGPAEPPRWAQLVLDRHPHPITVHFPIALGLVAALFILLSLVFGGWSAAPYLARAAFYNLVVSALTMAPAIATGLLSWYYNYSAVWTPIYRAKTALSIVLVVLTLAALALKLFVVGSGAGPAFWVYALLVLAQAPTVVALGYYGGKITFPS